ncbi:MAG: hypothetical protein LUD19_03435 [Clostridia bacterium]|nr:hypothetical protein [Clostridia bacterium]
MLIDISKINYKVYLLRETGEQLDITDIASDLSWEENEGELSQRVSLTLANITYQGQKMSSVAKPNCYIIVQAEIAGSAEEVARGKITEWTPSMSGSTDDVELTGYDELYDLQASQDNRYISDGVSTDTAIKAIFDDWGIPVEKYDGPTTANAKTTFKNEYLSDIILELLDTAHKHGAAECIIRASKGKVSIIPKASNETIYCFEDANNLEMNKYKMSTSDMVTVVKVVATEDDDGRQAVEALVEGKTEYGKRQKIYVRDGDDDLATATAAAQEILDEEGEPTVTMSIKAPDVPTLRKGDKIKLTSAIYSGYAVIVSVQHNASSRTMTADIEKYGETESSSATSSSTASSSTTTKEYAVGDVVTFNGGYHYYTSTDTSPRGGVRTSGKATITVMAAGAAHPYHLIGGAYSNVGGSSNVYGWVDAGTFS